MFNETSPEFINVLKENTIAELITGSTSYKTNLPEGSDTDLKCITILPPHIYFQLGEPWETTCFTKPDIEFHSLKKFISLLNKQNPTISELLFTDEQFVVKSSSYYTKLRKHRELFLTTNVFYSFGGYAREQLVRIQNAFGNEDEVFKTTALKETLESLIHTFEETYTEMVQGSLNVNSVEIFENGKYNVRLGVHFDDISTNQLNGMLSEITSTTKNFNKQGNRNKRANPEKLFKHAMHLIRLLIMGIEILTEGKFKVYRSEDYQFFLDIRNGKYSWEEIFEMVLSFNEKLKLAFKNCKMLPEETDFVAINNLYNELMMEYYSNLDWRAFK